MEAASIPGGGERSILGRSPLARFPDRALKYGLTALAGLILALIVYFFFRLVGEAKPAFAKFGVLGFTFDNDWNETNRGILYEVPHPADMTNVGTTLLVLIVFRILRILSIELLLIEIPD